MKKIKTNKKIKRKVYSNQTGITLVALVVIIVVLLILAGVSISTLFGDSGIIEKAEEAQNVMDKAKEDDKNNINELSNWLDSRLNGTTGENTTEGNTAGGEDTQTTTENWTQNKTTVTNGTTTYTVGDDYTYDCGVSGYTGGWKVLGAEKGKLLIMSTVDVGKLGLCGISGDGTTSYPAGYSNGIDKLNEMCAPYGTNARSITVEDINRVTGYTPAHQTISITSENKYYYDNDTSNQSSTATGTYAAYAGEYGLATALGITDGSPVTGNAYYWYYPNTLTKSSSGTTTGIATDSPAYEMLFGKASDTSNEDGYYYWLASSCVSANSSRAHLCMCSVDAYGYVIGYYLWYSDNSGTNDFSFGVRAVVSL